MHSFPKDFCKVYSNREIMKVEMWFPQDYKNVKQMSKEIFAIAFDYSVLYLNSILGNS